LEWVKVPNTFDTDGYAELTEHPNGAAHFGVWVALLKLASRSKRDDRGALQNSSGRPHDAKSIARRSRFPVDVISEAIERFVHIGWLEVKQIKGSPIVRHEVADDGGCTRAGAERNGMERKGREAPSGHRARARRRAPTDIGLSSPCGRTTYRRAALELGITEDALETAFATWKDHEYRDPKSDWCAAWRNWCRKAVEYRAGQRGPVSKEQRVSRGVEQLMTPDPERDKEPI
jgi:hypothetical protein